MQSQSNYVVKSIAFHRFQFVHFICHYLFANWCWKQIFIGRDNTNKYACNRHSLHVVTGVWWNFVQQIGVLEHPHIETMLLTYAVCLDLFFLLLYLILCHTYTHIHHVSTYVEYLVTLNFFFRVFPCQRAIRQSCANLIENVHFEVFLFYQIYMDICKYVCLYIYLSYKAAIHYR